VIFIDTGPFLAKRLSRDPYSKEAFAGWERLEKSNQRIATSNFILEELSTLLARRAGCAFSVHAIREIYNSPRLMILRPDLQDEISALGIMEKIGDPAISFTDYLSFAIMRKRHIRQAFTFDRHFAKAGFEIWE
jgi:predicted nucleic acid-binding protein